MTPTVSVIIATYNRSRVLHHAIESVRRSHFSDWELIVVGDAMVRPLIDAWDAHGPFDTSSLFAVGSGGAPLTASLKDRLMEILPAIKVPSLIGSMLDKRAQGIKADLEAAKALHEEAKVLLQSYEKKHKEVQEQADRIVASAKEEAMAAAAQARMAGWSPFRSQRRKGVITT